MCTTEFALSHVLPMLAKYMNNIMVYTDSLFVLINVLMINSFMAQIAYPIVRIQILHYIEGNAYNVAKLDCMKKTKLV